MPRPPILVQKASIPAPRASSPARILLQTRGSLQSLTGVQCCAHIVRPHVGPMDPFLLALSRPKQLHMRVSANSAIGAILSAVFSCEALGRKRPPKPHV